MGLYSRMNVPPPEQKSVFPLRSNQIQNLTNSHHSPEKMASFSHLAWTKPQRNLAFALSSQFMPFLGPVAFAEKKRMSSEGKQL